MPPACTGRGISPAKLAPRIATRSGAVPRAIGYTSDRWPQRYAYKRKTWYASWNIHEPARYGSASRGGAGTNRDPMVPTATHVTSIPVMVTTRSPLDLVIAFQVECRSADINTSVAARG